jgi:DNA-binding transcriptional MerR regulator
MASASYSGVRVQGHYPIRAVAKITGLSLDTLRAWERRYAAVTPDRTERGRQYGPEQIERLLLLGRLTRQGHAIGQIAAQTDEQLRDLLLRPRQPASDMPPALIEPVLSAVAAFDASRAGDELSRLAALLSPRDVVYLVALPLMRETGIRWHNGTFAIAQEHLTSELLRSLLGGMMRLFRNPSRAVRIVLATPPGETHDFGILAAAMLAAIGGLEPVYLGPSLPALEIARAVERTDARIVALGVTYAEAKAQAEIRALAAAIPASVEFWLGGAGAAGMDLSGLACPVRRLEDLAAFESECARWKN